MCSSAASGAASIPKGKRCRTDSCACQKLFELNNGGEQNLIPIFNQSSRAARLTDDPQEAWRMDVLSVPASAHWENVGKAQHIDVQRTTTNFSKQRNLHEQDRVNAPVALRVVGDLCVLACPRTPSPLALTPDDVPAVQRMAWNVPHTTLPDVVTRPSSLTLTSITVPFVITPSVVYSWLLGFFFTPMMSRWKVACSSGCVTCAFLNRIAIGRMKRSYFGGLRVKPSPT